MGSQKDKLSQKYLSRARIASQNAWNKASGDIELYDRFFQEEQIRLYNIIDPKYGEKKEEEKIIEAIKEGNVEDILRGRQKYRIEPPTFVPDVFPTDINQRLFEYFYNQSDIKNIQLLLENSLIKLTKSSATDLYISILFFDSILFMEDKGIATFKIDTSRLVAEIASGIQEFRKELTKSITFNNGLTKKDPMKVIVRFNQRYKNKYNFSILED